MILKKACVTQLNVLIRILTAILKNFVMLSLESVPKHLGSTVKSVSITLIVVVTAMFVCIGDWKEIFAV